MTKFQVRFARKSYKMILFTVLLSLVTKIFLHRKNLFHLLEVTYKGWNYLHRYHRIMMWLCRYRHCVQLQRTNIQYLYNTKVMCFA